MWNGFERPGPVRKALAYEVIDVVQAEESQVVTLTLWLLRLLIWQPRAT